MVSVQNVRTSISEEDNQIYTPWFDVYSEPPVRDGKYLVRFILAPFHSRYEHVTWSYKNGWEDWDCDWMCTVGDQWCGLKEKYKDGK